MVFQKSGKRPKNIYFFFENKKIDIVQEYVYLGVKITSSGNFSLAQKRLSEKATNALYKIRKHLNFSRLSVKLASKIFDSMVLPILSYCSKVWSPYSKFDFGSWEKTAIEKVNLRFCKLYLEINRKASNVASKLEMTRFSLQIPIMKRILKYYLYLNDKNDNSIVKQAYIISQELENKGSTSYHSRLKQMLQFIDPRHAKNLPLLTQNTHYERERLCVS